jgi:hypothetical protein
VIDVDWTSPVAIFMAGAALGGALLVYIALGEKARAGVRTIRDRDKPAADSRPVVRITDFSVAIRREDDPDNPGKKRLAGVIPRWTIYNESGYTVTDLATGARRKPRGLRVPFDGVVSALPPGGKVRVEEIELPEFLFKEDLHESAANTAFLYWVAYRDNLGKWWTTDFDPLTSHNEFHFHDHQWPLLGGTHF